MRLDKALSNNTEFSRKELKGYIKSGNVIVNNEVIYDESFNVNEQDNIKLFDEIIDIRENIYLLLNKPKGYISATTDSINPTVIDLINEPFKQRLFPVGRLDLDTTGLIILTTDGAFSHYITSPKSHVNKTYLVTLDKPLTKENIQELEQGIILEGEKLHECKINTIDDLHYEFIIDEGKYHQVKLMANYCFTKVVELQRIKIGDLTIGNLKESEYRELSIEEVKSLQQKNN